MPAKKNQTQTGRPLARAPSVCIIWLVTKREPHHGQQGRDPVAAVEDVHRVLGLLAADEEHRDHGGEEPEGADDEGEEDPGRRVRPAEVGRDLEHRDAQDHGADVLGGRGLEQVRAAAGAVADVVADEVGDDARVAGIVLGDALLDLADEVGADVGGLGVDAAAELGEQGDEAGAEAEADDEERRLVDRDVADEQTWKSVKMSHTPSSDRETTRKPETAPPRIATCTASTRLRRAADAVRTLDRTLIVMPMMPESIEQPAPTRNAIAVRTPIGSAREAPERPRPRASRRAR